MGIKAPDTALPCYPSSSEPPMMDSTSDPQRFVLAGVMQSRLLRWRFVIEDKEHLAPEIPMFNMQWETTNQKYGATHSERQTTREQSCLFDYQSLSALGCFTLSNVLDLERHPFLPPRPQQVDRRRPCQPTMKLESAIRAYPCREALKPGRHLRKILEPL
jgi:hypothetical protein